MFCILTILSPVVPKVYVMKSKHAKFIVNSSDINEVNIYVLQIIKVLNYWILRG